MFEQVIQSPGSDTRNRRAVAFSLLLHGAALLLLFVFPLLFYSEIAASRLVTYIKWPAPPALNPPPTPLPAGQTSGRSDLRPTEPRVIRLPENIVPDDLDLLLPPDVSITPDFGISPPAGGMMGILGPPGAPGMPQLEGLTPDFSTPAPPPPPAVRKKEPLKIGGEIDPSRLIRRVNPVFPRMARIARVQGVVVLEATVDEEGNVIAVDVVSGHPLLNEAAVEAVRQWKYSPTLLNGEPVSIQAHVTVRFVLT